MENITENNKLIAEFMGIVFYDDQNAYYDRLEGLFMGKKLKYNNSWNWLMSVVEKIENLTIQGKEKNIDDEDFDIEFNFEVSLNSKQCWINRCAFNGDEKDFLSLYDARNYTNGLSKIDICYNSVVEFINWYNKK